MYQTLTLYTFFALVIFFIAVEIYRAKFFVKGVIVEFCPLELGIEEFISIRMKVQLKNGGIVEAEVSHCTMCMGHLAVGDEVALSRKDDRYLVNLPFKVKNNFPYQINCKDIPERFISGINFSPTDDKTTTDSVP